MQIANHSIGVCSWSLQAASLAELFSTVEKTGLSHVQLKLAWLTEAPPPQQLSAFAAVANSGLHVTAGMIGFSGEDYSSIPRIRQTGGLLPDALWEDRKRRVLDAGQAAEKLGLNLLTGHIGFIPQADQPEYATLVHRVEQLATALAERGVMLLCETGQETAGQLFQFLSDLPTTNVGVNFDPANMILYGSGDPLRAIGILGRHIRHVHVKDAAASQSPGVEWGRETPVGQGDVNWKDFLSALRAINYTGPLVIEREGGADRIGAIRAAVASLQAAAHR